MPPFPATSPLCHRADFPSQGGTVRAAFCRPAGSAQAPALVVLHGCGGFGGIDEVLARDLPAHGVATFEVDPGGTHAWKGAQRVAAERWTLAFLRRYLSLGAPR